MAVKESKRKQVSVSLVVTIAFVVGVVVYLICVAVGYWEWLVVSNEERSALAVFVGLLATAFAFLFRELSANVRYVISKGWEREISPLEFEMRDKRVYDGEEGKLRLVRDYTEVLGEVFGLLAVPLFPYVASIVVSAIGIVGNERVVAYVGAILLVWSFVSCGLLLIMLYRSMRAGIKVFAGERHEMLVRKLREDGVLDGQGK